MYGRIEFLKSPNIGIIYIKFVCHDNNGTSDSIFYRNDSKKTETINLIVTPVSLGISFISGVFVELSVLGDTVKKDRQISSGLLV